MTNVFAQEFSFQEQLFQSQTQYLYINLLYPLHCYNVVEPMIKILFFQMTKDDNNSFNTFSACLVLFGIMVLQVGRRRFVARLLWKLWNILARGVQLLHFCRFTDDIWIVFIIIFFDDWHLFKAVWYRFIFFILHQLLLHSCNFLHIHNRHANIPGRASSGCIRNWFHTSSHS